MRCRRVLASVFGIAVGMATPATAETKAEQSPLLVEIRKQHCLAMYDIVELRLKGKGDEAASITTRNGLKDFFVVTPGVVDCTGVREIPWRDEKDRAFIHWVLEATNQTLKSGVNMGTDYGIAPAPKATVPRL